MLLVGLQESGSEWFRQQLRRDPLVITCELGSVTPGISQSQPGLLAEVTCLFFCFWDLTPVSCSRVPGPQPWRESHICVQTLPAETPGGAAGGIQEP